MRPKELLRELEGLPHDARMRRMVEVGRLVAGDPTVRETVAERERGGVYERHLALQSCFGSGDGARALRGLSDPSRWVRGLALTLVPLVCDDAQAGEALDRAPEGARVRLLRRLCKQRRIRVIDAYVQARAAADDPDLGSLIAFTSPALAEELAGSALERARWADWRGLARIHPEIVTRLLSARIGAQPRLDPRMLAEVSAALPVLADVSPDGALAVATAVAQRGALSRLELQALADRRPVEVADLLLGSDDPSLVRLDRQIRRLGLDRLRMLLRRQPETLSRVRRWFRLLRPEERGELFDTVRLTWQDAEGVIAHDVVALLPRVRREAEARRHLRLPALAARDARRLPYASFLPWSEAEIELEPYISAVDADLRGEALAALIGVARYERGRSGDTLAAVRARRNEQDPVRQRILSALAALPPGIWRQDDLESLGSVLREALNARDLSPATAHAAQSLVVRVLPFHAAWSAEWLATLARERGDPGIASLLAGLSDSQVRPLVAALAPVLAAWETREREGQLVTFAHGLGRRLRLFDGLLAALERLLRETRNPWTADWALAAIEFAERGRLGSLAPALLREDRSWITRPAVQNHLHRRRQDLLTPFTDQRTYTGRFSTGKTRYVLPFTRGFGRWTPAQQAGFARTLVAVANDQERDTLAIQAAIQQLAALPAVSPDALIALASDGRETVRDTALTALGGLDGGGGVQTLTNALSDERARVAIYALRRALLAMPADRALPLLRDAPLDRVTVAKEVVRLVSELRTEDAYQELLQLAESDLHRDVRAALLRALWDHLERDETWPILERAAESGDPSLASILGRIPAEGLTSDAAVRLAALIGTLLESTEPRIRVHVLACCGSLPLAGARRLLLPRLFRALGSTLPDERSAAASAAFQLTTQEDTDLVDAAFERILGDRRALLSALAAFETVAVWRRTDTLPLTRTVLATLARDPLTVTARARLAARALPYTELAGWLLELASDGLLHADALSAVRESLQGVRYRTDADALSGLDATLAATNDECLRRLGLAALVGSAGGVGGWGEERLARLRAYQEDPSPLVAAAAQFTFPPEDIAAR